MTGVAFNRILLVAMATALLACAACGLARAHFLLNLNVRILHVEHLADGFRVYLRTPVPYLLAGKVGPLGSDSLPSPAPFTFNRLEDGKPVHYLDPAQVSARPLGLGQFAADGFRFESGGTQLAGIVEQVRIHRVGSLPDFATLADAKSVFDVSFDYPNGGSPAYVGDTVADIILRYAPGSPVYEYAISSSLNPGLPDQDKTANLILDHAPGGTKIFRARGLLSEPVSVSRSAMAAILTFIKEGIRHILEGIDHVLFVLCLTLGATRLKSLAWRVTGFTIGHSITLSAGFFGFVPSGAWFVPAVETGIALSIIYAAAVAVLPAARAAGSERSMFMITSAIGLLHGLGFSFVLQEILQVTSPNIWQSLLAFNVGVEIGQLAIVALVWPLFRIAEHYAGAVWRVGQLAVAFACIAIALLWTYERTLQLAGTLWDT